MMKCPNCHSQQTEKLSGWDDSKKDFRYCRRCGNLWDLEEKMKQCRTT